MDVERLLMTCCGFEDDGELIRFYLDSPFPTASLIRDRPLRADLFHLLSGDDAQAVRDYLAAHKAWDVLRLGPAYTRSRGVAAVRTAAQWHTGRLSPLGLFASNRSIRDDEHAAQLRRATRHLIASVLENPVHPGEYPALRLLAEVIDTAPLFVELCTAAEARPESGRPHTPAGGES